eukprot:5810785-Amphidinium_carterae.1
MEAPVRARLWTSGNIKLEADGSVSRCHIPSSMVLAIRVKHIVHTRRPQLRTLRPKSGHLHVQGRTSSV